MDVRDAVVSGMGACPGLRAQHHFYARPDVHGPGGVERKVGVLACQKEAIPDRKAHLIFRHNAAIKSDAFDGQQPMARVGLSMGTSAHSPGFRSNAPRFVGNLSKTMDFAFDG